MLAFATRRVRTATLIASAVAVLAGCRQDRILAEAAKVEPIEAQLQQSGAALVSAPQELCRRRLARAVLVQTLNPTVVAQRIAGVNPTGDCAPDRRFVRAVTGVTGVIDGYAKAIVAAAKGGTVRDPKLGATITSLRAANVAVLPGIQTADVDEVSGALEQLIGRNVAANQVRHIAHEANAPLARLTAGLTALLTNTSRCGTGAGTWCSIFEPERKDLLETWTSVAQSMETSRSRARSRDAGGRTAASIASEWSVRDRFEADVKAHEDAVAAGAAYAAALRAFQTEHAAIIAAIDARAPDSTALFDR